MSKGLHTQGLVILLQSAQGLDVLRRHMSGFNVVKETPSVGEIWMGGPGLLVAYRPEVNGYIAVDIVDRRWPDHMGDPKKEAMLFGCWTL